MLEEAGIGKQPGAMPPQPPLVFSKSEVSALGPVSNSLKEVVKEETPGKQDDKTQPPVVFSKSESIPLGFSNKLLRKCAYGLGVLSFVLTGLSGISHKNHWRTASGLGSAGINVASLFMQERDDPLPDTSLSGQFVHSLRKPQENTLFFNRTSTFVTDILKFAAGITSARKTELLEGVWKIGIKTIDIAGISDQDRREKLALKTGKDPNEVTSPIRKIFANRWVSLSNSAIASGLQITQGVQHHDKKMLTSGIFYFMAVSCLAADNAIMESKIKKANADRGR